MSFQAELNKLVNLADDSLLDLPEKIRSPEDHEALLAREIFLLISPVCKKLEKLSKIEGHLQTIYRRGLELDALLQTPNVGETTAELTSRIKLLQQFQELADEKCVSENDKPPVRNLYQLAQKKESEYQFVLDKLKLQKKNDIQGLSQSSEQKDVQGLSPRPNQKKAKTKFKPTPIKPLINRAALTSALTVAGIILSSIFLTTNLIGWIVACTLVLTLLAVKTASYLKRAYHRHQSNHLLMQHNPLIANALRNQNRVLKQNKADRKTRRYFKENALLLSSDNLTQDNHVTCIPFGDRARGYIHYCTKARQLFFSDTNSSYTEKQSLHSQKKLGKISPLQPQRIR